MQADIQPLDTAVPRVIFISRTRPNVRCAGSRIGTFNTCAPVGTPAGAHLGWRDRGAGETVETSRARRHADARRTSNGTHADPGCTGVDGRTAAPAPDD